MDCETLYKEFTKCSRCSFKIIKDDSFITTTYSCSFRNNGIGVKISGIGEDTFNRLEQSMLLANNSVVTERKTYNDNNGISTEHYTVICG